MMRVLQAGWSPIGDWPAMNTTGSGRMATTPGANPPDWVGGMPVGLVPSGFVVGGQAGQCVVLAGVDAAASTSNFIGLMFNNHLIDKQRGKGEKNVTFLATDALPTIVPAPCYVEMWKGTSGSTTLPMSHDVVDDRSPWITTELTAVGDLIFIEENADPALNGMFTETAGTVNTGAVGRVIKGAATDAETLTALFWCIPDGLVAS